MLCLARSGQVRSTRHSDSVTWGSSGAKLTNISFYILARLAHVSRTSRTRLAHVSHNRFDWFRCFLCVPFYPFCIHKLRRVSWAQLVDRPLNPEGFSRSRSKATPRSPLAATGTEAPALNTRIGLLSSLLQIQQRRHIPQQLET